MDILFYLLAAFGLAFLIKETEGPWGIISWIRNILMRNKYVGVFFYKLLSCYFCLGFHCGWIVYLLSAEKYRWNFLILWGLAGAIFSLILGTALNRLSGEDNE
jgi:hypothetical protein